MHAREKTFDMQKISFVTRMSVPKLEREKEKKMQYEWY